ncbi:MAG: histidine ammonia-lyase [Sulfobacillus sp.]
MIDHRPWPLDGHTLTAHTVYQVAVHHQPVTIAPEVAHHMAASRHMVERYLAEERIVYGVTTGFGRFSDVVIPENSRQILQLNLLRSHAAGVGVPFDPAISRAMLLLRANALAKGYSGVRLEVVDTLLAMLNRDVTPVIPCQGSVGASGDLAPLAHLALVLVGEGEAWFAGQRMPGKKALELSGISPIRLEAKEGLALINGTQAMTAMGALAVHRAGVLADWADILGAVSTEVLRGIPAAFSEAVALVRPHPGMAKSARNLRHLLQGSQLTTNPGELRVQDAYSIRCMPQVHGASREGLGHITDVVTREMNSATDNPLLFDALDMAISAGNFHGQPVALVLDYLAIVLAEWANISERRIERMVNPALSGLPAFLVAQGGLNSGLMLAQYTAASLVSENKVLAHPSSVDSIPTSANQEDHVSMGTTAGRKALQIMENLVAVLAIEAICAAQAADLLGPQLLSPRSKRVYDFVRETVAPWETDRVLATDIGSMVGRLESIQAQALVSSLLES